MVSSGRLVACLAVVLVLLSGCLVAEKPATIPAAATSASPSASTSVETNETLREKGRGGVRGDVKDEYGSFVTNAHVALMGTQSFSSTDTLGRFEFREIPPATYSLRVDKQGLQTYEGPVTVHAGEIVTVNVSIVHLPDPNPPRFEGHAHRHDWWGDDTEYVIFDQEVTTGPGGACVGAVTFACSGGAQFVRFYSSREGNDRPNNVWPGTGKMTIRARNTAVVQPFIIEVDGPGDEFSWAKTRYTVTQADQTITVAPILEHNTDPPHFRSSGWVFRIWAGSPASAFVGPFRLTVTIHKDLEREPVLDPPHPDYWDGQKAKTFNPIRTYANYTKLPGYASGDNYGAGPNYANSGKWSTAREETVTIGTGKMIVTMAWTNTDATLPSKPGLMYCPASEPCVNTFAQWTKPEPTTDGANKREYQLDVRPADWDSPYLNKTRWQWRWYFDDAQGLEVGTFKGTIDWTIEIQKID